MKAGARDALIAALAFAVFLALPAVVQDPYLLHVLILFFLSTILGQSWNILGGYAGQYSIGHAAFYGVGAYVTALLLQNAHVAPWYGVWAGMLGAVLAALVVGAICFRLRGPYFVLASIAVAEILRLCAINLDKVTNGAQGVLLTDLPPLKLGSWLVTDFSSKTPFYYAALALAAAAIAVSYAVDRTKLGYLLQAIREDEDAADSLGINLSLYKNSALAISAAFGGLAGGLAAIYVGFIDPPTVLSIDQSIEILLVCIIGGVGTILGPVLGAAVLVAVSEALRSNLLARALFATRLVSPESAMGKLIGDNLAHAHVLIYGVLVVVVILFMPDGVLGFVSRLRRARA